MARVLLVHWKPAEAEALVAALRKVGHEVRVLAPSGMQMLRALAGDPPDAIVIDLGRLPSLGRAVATALRQRKATRHLPMVFAGGDPEKVARVKALLPDAAYTTWRGLIGALRKALSARPKPDPVVPGTMAGYSGTPLPRKPPQRGKDGAALGGHRRERRRRALAGRTGRGPIDPRFARVGNQNASQAR